MLLLDYLLVELERAAADGDHGSKPVLSESRPWPEDTAGKDLAPDDEDDSGTDRGDFGPWADQSTSNASRAPSKLERWKSDVLEGWFMNHLSRPYPVKKDKAALAEETKLTEMQVRAPPRPSIRPKRALRC